MTTKRKPIARARGLVITPEAVAAYRKGDSLALKRALGLKPWQGSPVGLPEGERPIWWNADDWALQHELRAALEAAS